MLKARPIHCRHQQKVFVTSIVFFFQLCSYNFIISILFADKDIAVDSIRPRSYSTSSSDSSSSNSSSSSSSSSSSAPSMYEGKLIYIQIFSQNSRVIDENNTAPLHFKKLIAFITFQTATTQ